MFNLNNPIYLEILQNIYLLTKSWIFIQDRPNKVWPSLPESCFKFLSWASKFNFWGSQLYQNPAWVNFPRKVGVYLAISTSAVNLNLHGIDPDYSQRGMRLAGDGTNHWPPKAFFLRLAKHFADVFIKSLPFRLDKNWTVPGQMFRARATTRADRFNCVTSRGGKGRTGGKKCASTLCERGEIVFISRANKIPYHIFALTNTGAAVCGKLLSTI